MAGHIDATSPQAGFQWHIIRVDYSFSCMKRKILPANLRKFCDHVLLLPNICLNRDLKFTSFLVILLFFYLHEQRVDRFRNFIHSHRIHFSLNFQRINFNILHYVFGIHFHHTTCITVHIVSLCYFSLFSRWNVISVFSASPYN